MTRTGTNVTLERLPLPASPGSADAGDSSVPGARGLPDRHQELLRQVALRAGAVLSALYAGRPAEGELDFLLDYLVSELLDQMAQEDRAVAIFGLSGEERSRADRLARDHVRLRAAVDALQRAAGGTRAAPQEVSVTVRVLVHQLTSHLLAEQAAWQAFRPVRRAR